MIVYNTRFKMSEDRLIPERPKRKPPGVRMHTRGILTISTDDPFSVGATKQIDPLLVRSVGTGVAGRPQREISEPARLVDQAA